MSTLTRHSSWVYSPELYPLRVRGKAVSITTASNWIFNFALGYFTPPAFVNIKYKTYFIFGVFSFAMAVLAFFMFLETAGKTLEEVEHIFTDKVPAWKTRVNYKTIRAVEHGGLDSEKVVAKEELSSGSDNMRHGDASGVKTTAAKAA
jgi:hypothetical protein